MSRSNKKNMIKTEMDRKQTALDLLKKIAEEQGYVGCSTVVEDLSGGGSSIMSALFRAALRAPGKPDLKLFAKVAIMPDNLRKLIGVNVYTTELYCYIELCKLYKKLEEKHGVPEELRLRLPKLYGSSDEFLKETLVLEDLNAQGFQNFNREKSADMEYMSAGVGLMAQFHALSMAYCQEDPEGFRRTSKFLRINESDTTAYFLTTKSKMLVNALAVAEDRHKERLEKYFDEEPSRFMQITNNYRCHNRNILVHIDFKPSNLMHRRRNGKLEIVPLDFQMVHDGDPVVELIYFIFTATDEQFRRTYYHALLDVYYERLRAALVRLHVDPELTYPENIYRARLEECSMMGLVLAVALLPVVLAEEDKAPEFGSEDSETADLIPSETSPLYKERLNGVLNDYVEWGLL